MSTGERQFRHRPPALPSDLGQMRTIMAADRTLMAWVRTALSMISFGFTIYKFLETASKEGSLAHPNSPQQVGLFLVGLGVSSIVLGVFSYWATLRDIEQAETFRLGRPALLIAVVLGVAGIGMFVSIASRLV